MKKEMKKRLQSLKKDKMFLEKMIGMRINDLQFYNEFNILDKKQKVINYLDMTWQQYDEIIQRIKQVKKTLANW
jgi:hypothetical protein